MPGSLSWLQGDWLLREGPHGLHANETASESCGFKKKNKPEPQNTTCPAATILPANLGEAVTMATPSPAWAQTLELSSLLQEGGCYSEGALKRHF